MSRESEEEHIGILTDAMKFKMSVNRYKGDLAALPMEKLIQGLKDEVDELIEALRSGSQTNMMLEAADVSIYALAAVIQAMEKERAKRKLQTEPK